jgi:hypothetical protein
VFSKGETVNQIAVHRAAPGVLMLIKETAEMSRSKRRVSRFAAAWLHSRESGRNALQHETDGRRIRLQGPGLLHTIESTFL